MRMRIDMGVQQQQLMRGSKRRDPVLTLSGFLLAFLIVSAVLAAASFCSSALGAPLPEV